MSATNAPSTGPPPAQALQDRGYGASTTQRSHLGPSDDAADLGATPGNPTDSSPLSQSVPQQISGRFNEEWDASRRGSSVIDGGMHRSNSVMSQGDTLAPSRSGTLKKKPSLKRGGSLKRPSSRRSSRAGSVRSLVLQPSGDDETNSAFFSPVPTTGNPTEILANRFQAWRKVLKDLIAYFKEIQASYDHKSKTLLKVSNVINNTTAPPVFLSSGVVDDALQILRAYHRNAIMESNKSKDIENDVILALVGLRSDLNQKIKEIKNLSGDFKNSVDKEMAATRRAVNSLQECLGRSDVDASQTTGKQDPYLLRLAVDRQVEKQIDEENYLHQAYLNLEASGRELEAIVVGEIQKSYNAYAGILKREAEGAYSTIEELRTGPIAMPNDHEWNSFVESDEHFVDPRIPVRQPQNIRYPGRDNPLAEEIRAGLLERKTKYLKGYAPGWYVLSPTHLHEFKSADKTQAPIMSLYLPEQKLGSHSQEGGSSSKFMLKGRQTGSMHRGHSWIFRAESRETMLEWYSDIKNLTEKSPQERSAFVRQHARSVSGSSHRASSISSDGMVDEEDEEPFSATNSAVVAQQPKQDVLPRRPQAGGRFPSDLEVSTQRGLQAPLSPSSGSSGVENVNDHDVIVAAGALPGSGIGQHYGEDPASPSHAARINQYAQEDGVNPYTYQPITHTTNSPSHTQLQDPSGIHAPSLTAAGLGAVAGAAGTEFYRHTAEKEVVEPKQQLQEHAAREASTIASQDTHDQQAAQTPAREARGIAAPDTYEQHAAQKAFESTVIAAPDVPTPIPSHFMSGGRSQGDLTTTAPELLDDQQTPSEQKSMESAPKPLIDVSRPSLITAGQNHQSVSTISQLHIPGEFPKNVGAAAVAK